MLYKVDLDYSDKELIKNLSTEDYEKLRSVVMAIPENKETWYGYDMIVDKEGIIELTKICKNLQLKQIKNTYSPSKSDISWVKQLDAAGTAVHVHIPNIGLLMINEVCILEDSCTDKLQEYLNNNWRILAVCPPNGVRRPDYIMGRTKNKEK
jgi:hypothetical protein